MPGTPSTNPPSNPSPTTPAAGVRDLRDGAVDSVLARLETSRGRRIHVVPLNFAGLPLEGTWVHARGGDVIFYDQHVDAAGRDRIVHEQLTELLRDTDELVEDERPTPRQLIEQAISARPSPALAALILGTTFVAPTPPNRSRRASRHLPTQQTRAS